MCCCVQRFKDGIELSEPKMVAKSLEAETLMAVIREVEGCMETRYTSISSKRGGSSISLRQR